MQTFPKLNRISSNTLRSLSLRKAPVHLSQLSPLPDSSACDEKQSAVKNSVSTKGKTGRGGVGEDPALQGVLRLRNRCWLPAHRAPERRAVQTLKHQRNRPWGKSSRFWKQVPAKLCWTHRLWAAQEGRHHPPGAPPPGTELGLQGRGCGLPPRPQMHREHTPPKWAKRGVSLRGLNVQCQGKRIRRTQRKAKPAPNL